MFAGPPYHTTGAKNIHLSPVARAPDSAPAGMASARGAKMQMRPLRSGMTYRRHSYESTSLQKPYIYGSNCGEITCQLFSAAKLLSRNSLVCERGPEPLDSVRAPRRRRSPHKTFRRSGSSPRRSTPPAQPDRPCVPGGTCTAPPLHGPSRPVPYLPGE